MIADNWLSIIISILLKPLYLYIKRVIVVLALLESCKYYIIKYR
jgi:hypothetical protein